MAQDLKPGLKKTSLLGAAAQTIAEKTTQNNFQTHILPQL
jgi:hypothetical protein